MKDIPTELKAEPPGAWLSVGSEGTKPVGPAPALPVGPACGGQAGVEAGRCRVPFLGQAVCQLGHGAARDCMCAEHPDCPQRNQPAPDSSQPITYHATSTRVRQHILSCCCVPGVHTHTHTHTHVSRRLHSLQVLCAEGICGFTHLPPISLPSGDIAMLFLSMGP